MNHNYLLIALFALCLGCSTVTLYDGFPYNFSVHIYGDYSSSGASRSLDANLTYVGEALESGIEHYEVWSGDGNHLVYDCRFDNSSGDWLDINTRDKCGYNSSILPTERSSFIRKTVDGGLKQGMSCDHMDTCYDYIQ